MSEPQVRVSSHPHYPDALLTTSDVARLIGDPSVRLIQVDFEPDAYAHGHLPGAVSWDWSAQLRNPSTHEVVTHEEFTGLLSTSGVSPSHKVVLYGDNNNWFACWACWLMTMLGHQQVWVMDGGTRKWIEEGRPVSFEPVYLQPCEYTGTSYDTSLKATTEEVFRSIFSTGTHRLVDVRSAAEYEGLQRGPAGHSPNCQVGGHIPTAINVPWNLNCREDGTFKAPNELTALYESFGINPDKTVITYCAIGERASLSWFVLKVLLGYPVVLNYDRSMSEWSAMPNAPIVGGEAA